jgi:hypothetical protein
MLKSSEFEPWEFTVPTEMRLTVACFDESGKYRDSEKVFAFAGIQTFPDALRDFTTAWEACLEEAKLDYTSMKEAMHLTGPYKQYRERHSERDAIIKRLAKLVVNAPMRQIASPLDSTVVEQFNALPPEEKKKLGGEPYYAAFETCLIGCLQDRTDTAVHVICDIADEYSAKCVTAFQKIRSARADYASRCVGICFKDDKKCPGLQAADMVAYCHRQDVLHNTQGKVLHPLVAEIFSWFGLRDQSEQAVGYLVGGIGLGGGEIATD